jgi:flavodoxin
MKAIVVYYSLEGNTAYAAEMIAAALGADTLRLQPKKAYPSSGFRKFFWGGKSAVMAETPPLRPYAFDAAAWDRVIFGFPVWAGTLAPPLRSFLRDNAGALAGKPVAAFACQSGKGGEKALGRLEAILGRPLDARLTLIDPKTRPSAENGEKLRAFCEKVLENG